MIVIIYETHATSLDNENGLASGHYDVDLSPRGEQQARELGDRHRQEPPDAVFCSDLKRASRTVEIAFGNRGIRIVTDNRLRELDYGDWTRRPSKEVDAERLRHVTEPFPNGESYTDAMARVGSFLVDLLQNHAGTRVVVIGHVATHYGLEYWINGRPLEELVRKGFVWQPGWRYDA